MQTPPIVAPEAWEAARLRLLVKEKELTKVVAARRRRRGRRDSGRVSGR